MTTFQSEDCQTNDLNELFPMCSESLQFPLDNSMQIVFTGYYNGFNVEVRSKKEIDLLHHMGCFGKGSASRSRPTLAYNNTESQIIRKRQYLQRNFWYKKFYTEENRTETDEFLQSINELSQNIADYSHQSSRKDIIDLVSSDDDVEIDNISHVQNMNTHLTGDKSDYIVIVPNSDSEEDNYFTNLKPKCCINNIQFQEKLILTMEETFFLLYGLGCLQVVSHNNNSLLNIKQCWTMFTEVDKKFLYKYVVYHYFRSKGYVVKPGIKFGGDFLLYKEGPTVSHADFIVVIKYKHTLFDWISILGHVRMATTTVKEILIIDVIEPTAEIVNLPEDLSLFSVRAVHVNRNIPMSINIDDYISVLFTLRNYTYEYIIL